MAQLPKIPKVWDLLERFKETCRNRGWKTTDFEDVIKIDDEYNNFIGTRTTHPSTFKRIVASKRLAIPEGTSYQAITVSYTAWVFQQPPSKQVVEVLVKDSELTKKAALYDLSRVYQGKPICLKLNETGSQAFTEFERFLKDTYGVETKPLYEPLKKEPKTFRSKLLGTSQG
ncbi:MAG: hypothetical protein JSV51_01735 [Candidatus Bathyarchaeota archaeon]|nr:MAG: hypothetical protein JSV51_01735 [Candidatus Bathyarchaeota archaeon]